MTNTEFIDKLTSPVTLHLVALQAIRLEILRDVIEINLKDEKTGDILTHINFVEGLFRKIKITDSEPAISFVGLTENPSINVTQMSDDDRTLFTTLMIEEFSKKGIAENILTGILQSLQGSINGSDNSTASTPTTD